MVAVRTLGRSGVERSGADRSGAKRSEADEAEEGFSEGPGPEALSLRIFLVAWPRGPSLRILYFLNNLKDCIA